MAVHPLATSLSARIAGEPTMPPPQGPFHLGGLGLQNVSMSNKAWLFGSWTSPGLLLPPHSSHLGLEYIPLLCLPPSASPFFLCSNVQWLKLYALVQILAGTLPQWWSAYLACSGPRGKSPAPQSILVVGKCRQEDPEFKVSWVLGQSAIQKNPV